MNLEEQTLGAFAIANEKRKKSLLQYVSEGATSEDLDAAGYTSAEVAAAFPPEPSPNMSVPAEFGRDRQGGAEEYAAKQGAVESYTPTYRQNLNKGITDTFDALGIPEAKSKADVITGDAATGQIGFADFSPLTIAMGTQEGSRQIQAGLNTGSKTDVALGALNVGLSAAEAIPGGVLLTKMGKAAAKGLGKASRLFSKAVPPKPVSKPKLSFNNTLFDEADFEDVGGIPTKPKKPVYKEDLEAEINFMLGEELTPEEGLAKIKKSNEEYLSYPEGSILGDPSRQKDKLFSSLKDEELFKLAEDLPHWEDPKYQEYIDNVLVPVAQYQGVEKNTLLELVNDISAYLPSKENPQLANLAEKPLPKKAPVGERAAKEARPRPTDAKAEALNFKDTVYHTSVSPKEFTKFDLGQGFIGETKAAQDLLGVHVGTARAAAERNFQAVRSNDTPQGFTMELRARTTDPVTKEDLAKMFGYKPEDIFSEGKTPLTEGDLIEAINIYEDMFFKGKDRPENARELAAVAFRRELAREGYTHIPYINNVEDKGSTSLVMLVDRPKDSAAVLRDVRAKFEPKKITSPDLRFAEGGMVEDEQMNRLMQEGGIAGSDVAQEPVTGNEVPPGALPSEVRDDIPAQLSEGEYVVPADVVRFFGVRFFEDLRSQAKQGLSEMEANGRIGGTSVNSDGIPMEEDEELSPEEEQMLKMALGSTNETAGMAVGGDVEPFDRTKFTLSDSSSNTGRESRKYVDPTTGVTQTFQFLFGQPVTPIPSNFVPWTQELQDNATKTGQTITAPPTAPEMSRDTSGGGSGPSADTSGGAPGGGGSGGGGFNYDNWAKENQEALESNPYQFGLDALTDKTGQLAGKVVAGAGLMSGALPLAAVGVGVSAYNKVQNIAEASAALKVMEAKGLTDTENYKSLQKVIGIAVDALPAAQKFLVEKEIMGSGNKYFKSYEDLGAKPKPATTPAKPGTAAPAKRATTAAVTPSSNRDRQDGGWSNTPVAPAKPTTAKPLNTGTGVKGLMNAGKTATPDKPASAPKKETVEQKQKRGGGYKDGGLVSKPARKNKNY